MTAHLPGTSPRVTVALGPQAPELPATATTPARPGWAAVTLTVGGATVELTPRHAERLADALRRLASMSRDGWVAPERDVLTETAVRAARFAAGGPVLSPEQPGVANTAPAARVAFHPSPADLAARRRPS
ncbi:hypothetical protein GCM10027047_01240 [Rhodococcus aerolatus]